MCCIVQRCGKQQQTHTDTHAKSFTISPDLVLGVNASREGLIGKCASFQRKSGIGMDMALSEHGFYAPKRFTVSHG